MDQCGRINTRVDLIQRRQPSLPVEYEAGWASVRFWTRWRKEKLIFLEGMKLISRL